MIDCGAIYIVTGKDTKSSIRMLEECLRSTRLLLNYSPEINCTVALDKESYKNKYIKKLETLGVNLIKVKPDPVVGYMGAKSLALNYSPYKYNLILDNDTLPIQDLTMGFNYIKNRDIALSIAPRQEFNDENQILTNFQNGVMFVRKTVTTQTLFALWHDDICKNDAKGPTRFILSRLLHEFSDVNIYPLSYYWNFRIDYLKDYEITNNRMKQVLPYVRVIHSHLENTMERRKRAISILKSHPRFEEINLVGLLGL